MSALGERHPEADGICPTGCGRSVKRGHLMCGQCWGEVPKHIQREVLSTWRAYGRAAGQGADDFLERRAAYESARESALGSIR
jgi:hypothetical protein